MFNFFNEIKSNIKEKTSFNLVNISGKIVYIEGHKELVTLSREKIVLSVKTGIISIEGKEMILQELFDNCVKISGKIQKIEVFDDKN